MTNRLRLLLFLSDMDILPELFKEGLISSKIQFYYEVRLQVRATMKQNGGKKTEAVENVAFRLNITPKTVYAAIAFLEN